MSDEISIEAWFAAPLAEVFDAWTQPEQLAAWFAAGEWRVKHVDFELREGAAWRIDFAHPDGSTYSEVGTIIEVRPCQRLEFTLLQRGLDLPAAETRVVVQFDEQSDGTFIRFRQTGFGTDRARRDGNEAGWHTCFEKLRRLTSSRVRVE